MGCIGFVNEVRVDTEAIGFSLGTMPRGSDNWTRIGWNSLSPDVQTCLMSNTDQASFRACIIITSAVKDQRVRVDVPRIWRRAVTPCQPCGVSVRCRIDEGGSSPLPCVWQTRIHGIICRSARFTWHADCWFGIVVPSMIQCHRRRQQRGQGRRRDCRWRIGHQEREARQAREVRAEIDSLPCWCGGAVAVWEVVDRCGGGAHRDQEGRLRCGYRVAEANCDNFTTYVLDPVVEINMLCEGHDASACAAVLACAAE
jgi:hypothetical protein